MMLHLRGVGPALLAILIVMLLAGAARASAVPRIWLFTPALSGRVSPEFAARPVEVTTRLATALRADPSVTLVDSIDEADVIVEVGAIPRRSVSGSEKTVEVVTLTLRAGRTRQVLQATARRAKEAEADALRQLLAWLHDHAGQLETASPD